jgi:hypothetical protein
MVPKDGMSCLQTMNHVVKILTLTDGMFCLAQVQQKMMDMPPQRTIKRTYYTMVKRKCTKGKLRSTKHTHNAIDRVTQSPLTTGGERWSSGRVRSSLLFQ